MPPMGTMNSHTTELQTPELRPTGLAPQGTRPEGLVDSDSKSVAASPNLSMALKWPIIIVVCEFIVPIGGILSDRAIRDETPFSKTLAFLLMCR